MGVEGGAEGVGKATTKSVGDLPHFHACRGRDSHGINLLHMSETKPKIAYALEVRA